MAFIVVGPIHVYGVPVGGKPAGNTRANADETLGSRPRAEADHHLVGDGRLSRPWVRR